MCKNALRKFYRNVKSLLTMGILLSGNCFFSKGCAPKRRGNVIEGVEKGRRFMGGIIKPYAVFADALDFPVWNVYIRKNLAHLVAVHLAKLV